MYFPGYWWRCFCSPHCRKLLKQMLRATTSQSERPKLRNPRRLFFPKRMRHACWLRYNKHSKAITSAVFSDYSTREECRTTPPFRTRWRNFSKIRSLSRALPHYPDINRRRIGCSARRSGTGSDSGGSLRAQRAKDCTAPAGDRLGRESVEDCGLGAAERFELVVSSQ